MSEIIETEEIETLLRLLSSRDRRLQKLTTKFFTELPKQKTGGELFASIEGDGEFESFLFELQEVCKDVGVDYMLYDRLLKCS